jgi:hypothetical protein
LSTKQGHNETDIGLSMEAKAMRTRLVLLAAALLIALAMPGCSRHPSVAKLERLYFKNKTSLTNIVTMVHQDKALTRVAPGFTRPENPQTVGVSSNRVAEYRRLLRRAGITHGFESRVNDETIEFIVSTWGFSVSGSVKGLAYVKNPKSVKVVKDLKAVEGHPGGDVEAFQHIEGNWYIYFEYRR